MSQVITSMIFPAMFPNHLVDAKMALRASEPILVVGKKRARAEKEIAARPVKKNRQDDVIKAIGDKPVTERHILETVGDNRYTREILRRLMAVKVVQRMGRGGSNDPFLYRVVKCASEVLEQGIIDPASDIRMQRIESKILALLSEEEGFVTEKQIRAVVGDNTGTGKALRRLVKNTRVLRVGRGGAGDPFTYQANQDADVPFSLAQSSDDKPRQAKIAKIKDESCSENEEYKALSDRSTVPSSSHSVTDEPFEDRDMMDDMPSEDEEEKTESATNIMEGVMDKLKQRRGSSVSHLDRYLSSSCAMMEREVSPDSVSNSADEMDDFGIVEEDVNDLVDDNTGSESDIQDVPEGMDSMAPWVNQPEADGASAEAVVSSTNAVGDTFVDSFLL